MVTELVHHFERLKGGDENRPIAERPVVVYHATTFSAQEEER
jgi:hypothetical protein